MCNLGRDRMSRFGARGSLPERSDADAPGGRVIAERVVVDGNVVTVQVTTNLSGAAYHHWYLDGVWQAVTLSPQWSHYLDESEQVEIKCLPTRYSDFDRDGNAPAGYPARFTIEWRRSTTADVSRYRISRATGFVAGAYTVVGYVESDGRWSYQYTTPRLEDLTYHWFRVEGIGSHGNVGSNLDIGPLYLVRRPDMLDYTATYDDGTGKATFTEA